MKKQFLFVISIELGHKGGNLCWWRGAWKHSYLLSPSLKEARETVVRALTSTPGVYKCLPGTGLRSRSFQVACYVDQEAEKRKECLYAWDVIIDGPIPAFGGPDSLPKLDMKVKASCSNQP